MESAKSIANSFPLLKTISSKTKIGAEYLLAGIAIFLVIVLKRTVFSHFSSTFITLFIPVRDSILVLKSPSVKQEEFRRLLTVFIIISFFILLESIGINNIIPLFGIIKITATYWAVLSEHNSQIIKEIIINNIPNAWLTYGDSISNAVKAASKTIGEKVKIKNGSVEIDTDLIKKSDKKND